MEKSPVPPEGEAEGEQQSWTRPAPQTQPCQGQCITQLPSPRSLPKNHSHVQPTPQNPYVPRGWMSVHRSEVTEVLAPEMMDSHLPPAAIPEAHESQPEHKLLFLSPSTAALTASIGAGFPEKARMEKQIWETG